MGSRVAKSAAARSRRKPKDWYDIAFVLLHNDAGGPEQAAQAVLTQFAGDLVTVRAALDDLLDNFADRRPRAGGLRRADDVRPSLNPVARLLEVAAQQHGLFTVAQAAGVDVAADQVRRMAATGVLERRAQGVYRISTVPFDEQTELMEAVLWAKGRGLIAGESGLLLWDLADVNPRKIHIAVPPNYRPRRAGGELYEIHHVLVEAADRDEVHGVPVVSPALAIRQAIDWGVGGDMIEQAVRRAQAREHIGTQTAARLLVRVYDRALPDNKHGGGNGR